MREHIWNKLLSYWEELFFSELFNTLLYTKILPKQIKKKVGGCAWIFKNLFYFDY